MHTDLGPFRLHYRIGRGGSGEIWRGVHRPSRTPVAIKLLHRSDDAFVERFRAEVHAAARLNHVHIATMLDFGLVLEEGVRPVGSPYLVTELAQGSCEEDPPTSFLELRELLLAVLDALSHAHARGLLHLDVKPSNILITHNGPKLTDFGVAVAIGQAGGGGTWAFAAPEHHAGELLDERADVYGVGRTAEVLSASLSDLPTKWREWLDQLVARERDDRFPTCADAARALLLLDEAPAEGHLPKSDGSLTLFDAGLSLVGLREPTLVGRDDEFSALWASLQQVQQSGRAKVVVLSGGAGVGKSRLAREVGESAAALGLASCVRASHDDDGAPGHGLRRLVANILGGTDRLSERLNRHLCDGSTPPGEARALEAMLGPAPPGLRDQLMLTTRALARRLPRVVLLDDVHLDAVTVRWLTQIHGAAMAILVVATHRSDAPNADSIASSLRAVTWMEVGNLKDADVDRLLLDLVPMDASLRARLVARVDGNPLFALGLVRDWVRQGSLVSGAHGFELQNRMVEHVSPDLLGSWRQRIAAVGEALDLSTLQALEWAAVLGIDVHTGEWGPSPNLRARVIEALLEWGLGRQTATGLRFTHGIVREALVDHAKQAGRLTSHHLACAAAVIEPARRARHLIGAEKWDECLDPLREAAQMEISQGAPAMARELLALHAEAERLAQLSASDLQRGQRLALQLSLASRTSLEEVRQLIDFVEDEANKQDWPEVRASVLRIRAHLLRDDGDKARVLCQRALSLAPPPDMEAPLSWAIAESLRGAGRWSEVDAWYERGVDAAQRAGLESYPAMLANRAAFAAYRGLLSEAEEWSVAAIEAAGARPFGPVYADTILSRAEVLRVRGQLAEARELDILAWEVMKASIPREAPVIRFNMVMVDLEMGEVNRAFEELDSIFSTVVDRKIWWKRATPIRIAVAAAAAQWNRFEEACRELELLPPSHYDAFDHAQLFDGAARCAQASNKNKWAVFLAQRALAACEIAGRTEASASLRRDFRFF
jgi:eukaryotic-like serine/threonine-protein kinase